MKHNSGDLEQTSNSGIDKQRNDIFYPSYYFKQIHKEERFFKRFFFNIIKGFLIFFCQVVLSPRIGKVGHLSPSEVEDVYNREAKRYDFIHHMTTCGQDLAWRRKAGFFVANYVLNQKKGVKVRLLDLCTGTGLCLLEIDKVFKSWGIEVNILQAIGLDYCQEMLKVAEKNLVNISHMSLKLVRGDATALVKTKKGFIKFEENSFDIVTQVFGIGGIDNPQAALSEVLHVLKTGGQFYLVDMHKPIADLPGEWFCFYKWLHLPLFEERVYQEITLPLVLRRKWAWRDTTDLYYLIRLITVCNQAGKHYGFRVVNFFPEAQRWWFALPIMPVANIIVEKIEISKDEFQKRNNILVLANSA